MTDRPDIAPVQVTDDNASDQVYDRRRLTYSNTFESPLKRNTIRLIELLTGKLIIIGLIRKFEKTGPHQAADFWDAALRTMRIDIRTPQAQIENIPATGPVVVVANHPHGMVDGMVIAALIAKRRQDYRILTRSLLTGIDEVATKFLIPVPFPHEPDAQKKMITMRKAAMDQLRAGGVVAVFPAGVVASADTLFGPAVEREWNVFTAKLIRTSGATVVPLRFPGANSRWYQMANCISATLRQGLLLHEIAHSRGKPQAPVIGTPIAPDQIAKRAHDPRAFMAWLRNHTMSLRG